MAQVGLGFSFMELFWVRWCSAGHQKCADTRGDLVLGAGLGEVGKSLILGLFYEFILVVFANSHFSSCTGCVQILVLFSVLGWFSKTSLGPDPSAVLAFTFFFCSPGRWWGFLVHSFFSGLKGYGLIPVVFDVLLGEIC